MSEDPDAIQREIEQTRANLANTMDEIAERVSPKRVTARNVEKVKAKLNETFGHDYRPPADSSPGGAGVAGAGDRPTAYGADSTSTFRSAQVRLRTGRVVAAAVVVLLVVRRIRKRRRHHHHD